VSGYRGRFAPSPTGRAHLGTARTALVAWLRARAEGGRYLMRIEDLDAPRVVPGATEAMLADLAWLGLDWDEGPDVGGPHGPYVQSARLALYSGALERLKARGLAYPCTCSRKEIASIASAPHGDDGPVYPGTCRSGPTHPERAPAWRFRMDEPPPWDDALCGPSRGTPGDFVIQRADGVFAYQLAVVVDDAAMGITEVVRGEDLLASTPRQIALAEQLIAAGLPGRVPRFLHVPLVLDASGERLGKRHGSMSLRAMREQGERADTLVAALGRSLGLPVPEPAIEARALIERFDLAHLGREPTRWGSTPSAPVV
jgi:glutamyl-tRNA synthetase